MAVTFAPVRVFLVESQLLVAKALCQVLGQDPSINVIGHADSTASAPLLKLQPDLIVLDIDGHAVEMEEAIAACAKAAPRARVCVLSMHLRAEVMQRALAANADAYIVKDITPEALVQIVRSVAGGEFYADSRIAGTMLRRRAGVSRDLNELSRRESEIIRLIAEGLSNKEIGVRLSLSEKTVKNHISHIFAKLNINARSRAAVYAIRNGLV
jgi:two-component system response regulator DegU